jgi:hypothetical protein
MLPGVQRLIDSAVERSAAKQQHRSPDSHENSTSDRRPGSFGGPAQKSRHCATNN